MHLNDKDMYQVNFNYEILAVDLDRVDEFNNFKRALLNKDKLELNKIFSIIKKKFNKKEALKSRFIQFQNLVMPENYVKDFYFNIERCLKNLDPKVLEDRNCFTEISMDITIASFFHYYMNGIDNQLWNYRPYYYMSESLISENNLDYLYDKSDSIELNSRLFTEFDQWKIISYKDIEEYFLNVKPMNELDKFFQNYFRDAMDKKLIIVINKSDS